MTWRKAIHDIIPTNTRPHRIRIPKTDTCTECGRRDTLEHRLIECGEGTRTWNWTRSRILIYLITPWCRVLPEQLTGLQLVKKFPAFHGTRRFIIALTNLRHLSLSWASPIQSTCPHPTSWTRSRIERIIRSSAASIPHEWLPRPHFQLWPSQRHPAVLWVVTLYVNLRLNNPRTLLPQELMGFMRRSKWKMYKLSNRHTLVANFLTVLDMPY